MSLVFWDTNLFIYLFEDCGDFSQRVAALRERMIARGDQLYTSTLTLGEVLVKPVEKNDEESRGKYEEAISRTSTLLSFDREAAQKYSSIRRDRTLKAADAIQLACATVARMDLFITNDERLSGRTIPGIQFIVPLKTALL